MSDLHVKTVLNGDILDKFNAIKQHTGLDANTEVFRYCIQQVWLELRDD